MKEAAPTLSLAQEVSLVALRTLVGWHFFYEGYVKVLHPAWSRDGQPLHAWTSAGYLESATGPLAGVFHALAKAPWLGAVDMSVAALLILIGASLLLGLFTQSGCAGAGAMLAIFYLSAIPLGAAQTHAEGSYLIVNKNLIELASVTVLLGFRTGQIAGLDRWWVDSRVTVDQVKEAVA
jgi:thiosulfate dehydrogenase (quinone) large subunit